MYMVVHLKFYIVLASNNKIAFELDFQRFYAVSVSKMAKKIVKLRKIIKNSFIPGMQFSVVNLPFIIRD